MLILQWESSTRANNQSNIVKTFKYKLYILYIKRIDEKNEALK